MRSAFDFAPFRRSTVGFDRLFDMLENSGLGNAGENYPPFDLIKDGVEVITPNPKTSGGAIT